MTESTTPTMHDVARRAGVALSTVSRALAGKPGVSDELRVSITRVAGEIGYAVSRSASTLASGKTGAVGVLLPRIDQWFHSTVLAAFAHALADSELDLVAYPVETGEHRKRFFESLPLRRRVDAFAVVALSLHDDEIDSLTRAGVPVVSISCSVPSAPEVAIDDAEGAERAVRHLINLGHERIGIIRSTTVDGGHGHTSRRRHEGFRRAMEQRGLPVPPDHAVAAPWGIEGGALAMGQLLSTAEPPTAVFAESDEVAVGALRTLRRSGLSAGRDISVIGFDDHEMSELLDLSTIAQPVALQGDIGARLLLGSLGVLGAEDLADLPAPPIILPTRLVVRGTTARPAR